MTGREHLPWLRIWPQVSHPLGILLRAAGMTLAHSPGIPAPSARCSGVSWPADCRHPRAAFGLVEGLRSLRFITLDRIGHEIERPFENTAQDTPMTSLSRTLDIHLRQMLHEQAPAPVSPVAGFVY